MSDQLEVFNEKDDSEDLIMSPMQLLGTAISSGVSNIEVLEKIMDLQGKYEKRQAEKAFNQAFNKWQKEKPEIVKDKVVDFTNKNGVRTYYKYSSFPSMQKSCDPILSNFGLSYTFKQFELEGKIKIVFELKHISGHSEKTELSSPLDDSGNKNKVQSIGSTVSYLKRYTFMNGLGISADEDNDGITSSLSKEEQQEAVKDKLVDLYESVKEKLTPPEIKAIERIIKNEEVKSYNKTVKHLKKFR